MKATYQAASWRQNLHAFGYKERRDGTYCTLATTRQMRKAAAKHLKKQAKLAARKRNKGEAQA